MKMQLKAYFDEAKLEDFDRDIKEMNRLTVANRKDRLANQEARINSQDN